MTKALIFVIGWWAMLELIIQRAEYRDKKNKEREQKERERIREEIRAWRDQYNRPHPKYEKR